MSKLLGLELPELTETDILNNLNTEELVKELKYFETHAVAVGAKQSAETLVSKLNLDLLYTIPLIEYFTATNKALDIHMHITNAMAIGRPDVAFNAIKETYIDSVQDTTKRS